MTLIGEKYEVAFKCFSSKDKIFISKKKPLISERLLKLYVFRDYSPLSILAFNADKASKSPKVDFSVLWFKDFTA